MILFRLFFVLLLTQCFVFCGFSQDKNEGSYVKYTFRTYFPKSAEQSKKLQEEFYNKVGIQYVQISEKGESLVVANYEIKFKDISEIARFSNCKIEKLSETPINKTELEELMKKLNKASTANPDIKQ